MVATDVKPCALGIDQRRRTSKYFRNINVVSFHGSSDEVLREASVEFALNIGAPRCGVLLTKLLFFVILVEQRSHIRFVLVFEFFDISCPREWHRSQQYHRGNLLTIVTEAFIAINFVLVHTYTQRSTKR